MHFAWSHFRGVPMSTPHPHLPPHTWRRDRLSLSERVGLLQHCSRLRCEDFGPQSLHHSCWMKIPSHTFAVRKFPEKSSINAGHICFPETGGAKNPGRAPNGICSWRMGNSFVLMRLREFGKLMVFTTSHSAVIDRRYSETRIHRCTDLTNHGLVCPTSNFMRAAPSAFCGAARSRSN